MASELQDPTEGLLVVGVNHRSATAALRERLYLEPSDQTPLLAEIRAAGVSEAVVLATCDRLEVVAVDPDPAAAVERLTALLARRAMVEVAEFEAQSSRYRGADALRHVFAVAASLDSQIIGEPHVLGQVKESHRLAAAAAMVGASLEAVLQAAYATAKRVRTETTVAEQAVSIAAAAVQIARRLHGDLGRSSGLLIGLGEMGELLALEFKEAGLAHLVVTHASAARAESVAHRLRCNFRPWDELDAALDEADIVVTASGTGRLVVTAAMIQGALKRRRQRPVLIVDASVPGDVDPVVDEMDSAFVYSLDDLEAVAREGKASREATSMPAWKILGEEMAAFLRQRAERSAAPTVTALRRHFETLRAQVLTDGRLSAEAATRLLVNRLLHDPSEVLRQAAATGETERRSLEASVLKLFHIDAEGTGRDRAGGGEDEA